MEEKQGNAAAIAHMGTVLVSAGMTALARRRFAKAASAGVSEATYRLADMYETGVGGAVNKGLPRTGRLRRCASHTPRG